MLQQYAFDALMQSTKSRVIVANVGMVLDANSYQPKMPTEKLKEIILVFFSRSYQSMVDITLCAYWHGLGTLVVPDQLYCKQKNELSLELISNKVA